MSEGFRRQVFDFAERKATPIIRFEKGMRKDDVMHKRLRKFKRGRVSSLSASPRRRLACRAPSAKASGGEGTIPWIDYTTAMVKHYYFYCVDEDFGAFFIKFCSYFPYTGKLCINGHEYLNGQLARRGIEFEALDNGLLRCANPACHTRRPPWFCLWTHGSAGVYATYEMQVSCRKQTCHRARGLRHLGGHGQASKQRHYRNPARKSSGASSRASGLPRAWASRATFANGSTYSELEIEKRWTNLPAFT